LSGSYVHVQVIGTFSRDVTVEPTLHLNATSLDMDDSRVFDDKFNNWIEILQESEALADNYLLQEGYALLKTKLPIVRYTLPVRTFFACILTVLGAKLLQRSCRHTSRRADILLALTFKVKLTYNRPNRPV
jgi:hypothetical protein